MLTTYGHVKKRFYWILIGNDIKVLVRISKYDLQLFLRTQLRKITHRHQIMGGCKICIQYVTYQEYLNNWRK